jgi:hypothetical protein
LKRHAKIYPFVCLLACSLVALLTITLERTACGADKAKAVSATVVSPNGKIKIEIRTDAAGQLTWSVRCQDQTILAAAPLGLSMDGRNLGPRRATLGRGILFETLRLGVTLE